MTRYTHEFDADDGGGHAIAYDNTKISITRLTNPKREYALDLNVSADTHLFMMDVWQSMAEAFCKTKARHFKNLSITNAGFMGVPQLISLAMRALEQGPWCVLPSDKDAGFVLVERSCMTHIHTSMMVQPRYRGVFWHDLKAQDVLRFPWSVAVKMEKHFDQPLTSILTADSRNFGVSGLISKVQSTVKTHKPDGSVTLRCIHASINNPLNPMLKLQSRFIRHELDKYSHLVKDSRAMVRLLTSVQVPPRALFVKYDIKEFYMSGDHNDLARDATSVLDGDVRGLLRESVLATLATQYVEVPGAPNRVWRVEVGAGMGWMSSGDIADSAFLTRAEIPFALRRDSWGPVGLLAYARFRDDGVFVFDGDGSKREARVKFLRGFVRAAGYFDVVFDSFARDSLQVLDLLFWKGERWSRTGFLDVRVYQKPTCNWIPLSRLSAHHPNVHNSWPSSMIKRFHALTSSKEEAQRVSSRFLASLEQGLCQAPTKCTDRQYATTNAQPYTRMVLPFNVWFHNSPFFRSLRRVYDRWNLRFGQQGRCVRVGLAWRLGGTHLIHLLRRAALKPCISNQWQAFV